jgi:hypothetical protein
MRTLARSWQITRISFGVIRQEPALLLLPVLAVLFSALLIAAIFWPLLTIDPVSEEAERVLLHAGALVAYLGLAFVATFFNTCVVYVARERFAGRDPTLGASLAFAASRVRVILGWSLVAATVGVLFKLLDRVAERAGGVGRLVLGLVYASLGVTWTIVALFAVPAMVCHDVGPIEAVRRASRALRDTWGESLALEIGLGAMQIALGLVGIVGFVGLLQVGGASSFWTLLAGAAIYFVVLAATFNVAGTIYGTALYLYADTGELPRGFDADLLEGAIGSRRR